MAIFLDTSHHVTCTSVTDVIAAHVNLLKETCVVNYLRQPFHLLYRLLAHNKSEITELTLQTHDSRSGANGGAYLCL